MTKDTLSRDQKLYHLLPHQRTNAYLIDELKDIKKLHSANGYS